MTTKSKRNLALRVLRMAILLSGFSLVLQARPPEQSPKAPWHPFEPPKHTNFTVVSSPGAHATLDSEFTWELEWRPSRHILPGTQIELRSHNLRTYFSWRYKRIEFFGADVIMRRPFDIDASYLFSLKGIWTIARARLQYGLREGEPVRVRLSVVPPYFAGLFDCLTLWIADPRPPSQDKPAEPVFVRDPEANAILSVRPGPVEQLSIYARPMPGTGGKVRTVVAPEDRFGNPSEFVRPVPVDLEWRGRRWREEIKGLRTLELEPPVGVGRLKATVAMKGLAINENIANGVRDGQRLIVTGNPVWERSPDGRVAAFGEFHWHTEISGDGASSLPDALRSARDDLNMDFVAPSDHTPSEEQWSYTVRQLQEFNQPGVFATLFGWEFGGDTGHENYYFTNPNHPIRPHGELQPVKVGSGAELAADFGSVEPFIAIPHHTNAVSESHRLDDGTPYWYQYGWGRPSPYHRLVEILQTRGNQERNHYTDAWRGWYAYQASVQDALARGYRLGFTAGTDNHSGRPGRCFDAFEDLWRIPVDSLACTGIWTKAVERQEVWNALYARHTWAAWDTRALVYFAINNTPSGDDLEMRRGDSLVARIKMSSEDALQSIEIVSDKGPVWASSQDDLDFDLEVPLGRAERSTYFYLRALQRNGAILYASPVFIEVKGSNQSGKVTK